MRAIKVRLSDGRILNASVAREGDKLPREEDGLLIMADAEGLYEVGGTWIDGVYAPPAPRPTQPREKWGLELRVEELEAGHKALLKAEVLTEEMIEAERPIAEVGDIAAEVETPGR